MNNVQYIHKQLDLRIKVQRQETAEKIDKYIYFFPIYLYAMLYCLVVFYFNYSISLNTYMTNI